MNYEIKPDLEKILSKLKRKDHVAFLAVIDKIKEVTQSENVEHYKPLRYDFKNKRRVHVMKSFVLIFSYDREKDFVSFLDYGHHDDIYGKS